MARNRRREEKLRAGASASPSPGLPTAIGSQGVQAANGQLPYDPAGAMTGQSAPLMISREQLEAWQGPFPPPEAVERYELVLPGAFARIMALAEQSQQAQISAVERAQEYTQRDTCRGQVLGAVVSIIAMVGAMVCVVFGQPLVAAAFLGVPVLAVAKALVEGVGKRPKKSAQPAQA